MSKKISLYIHIPFCKSKCFYCDFLSYTEESNQDININEYINYLIQELIMYSFKLKDYSLYTVFIGGGTPSFIDSKYIKNIMNTIYKHFNTSKLEEITIECNPESLTRKKLRDYYSAGINRISIGLQTTCDKKLKAIGRVHTYNDFREKIKLVKEEGFDNINVDLIFALPNQDLRDVFLDLVRVIGYDIPHISYYSLIMEDDTPIKEISRKKKYRIPDDKLDRDMYHSIVKILKDNNYEHYEISNFAKKGYQCKHNRIYWEIEPYIGIGLGSHSNIDGFRYSNFTDFKSYKKNISEDKFPIEEKEEILKLDQMSEYCILGIRLISGISKSKFYYRFNKDIYTIFGNAINKHIKNKLLVDDGNYIKLTKKGLDLANLVEMDFLL